MNIRKNGEISNLVKLAKSGDVSSKKKLIEQNYSLIIRKAYDCYDKLNDIYFELFNSNIPNYLIDVDDVVSDFTLRSLKVLDTYLTGKSKAYFSIFLNMMLSSYINKYIRIKLKFLLEKLQIEYLQNLHFESMEILSLEDKQLVNNLKKIALTDNRLRHFTDFIITILNNNSYDEIKKITNLDQRRIGMKIKYIGKIYKKCLKDII